MSIWASLDAPDDEHPATCAIWTPYRGADGVVCKDSFEPGGKCDCRLRTAPIAYVHSGHFPSERDARGGEISLAMIPCHVSRLPTVGPRRSGRPHPFLRFGVSDRRGATTKVILTTDMVRRLRKSLVSWLRWIEKGVEPASPRHAHGIIRVYTRAGLARCWRVRGASSPARSSRPRRPA